ncbi:MAG: hypothetical protein JW940_23365 [Polyangiaceae bacterium]|nr:hypothetical protein [Polyangiaceae bacterium]
MNWPRADKTILATVARLFVAMLLLAPAVHAQQPTDARRAAARELGQEAIRDYEDGEYEEALEKFERAYAAVKAPSLGRWTALTMVKLGRLVKAAQRYLDVTRLPVDVGDSELQLEAKRASAQERAELLARIPRLRVRVEGARLSDVTVRVNGTLWSEARLGEDQLVDPGDYEAVGKTPEQTVARTATVVEGDVKQLVLRFHSMARAGPAPKPLRAAPARRAHPPQEQTTPPARTGPAEDEGGRGWSGDALRRTAMWTAFGVGAVGVGVGIATGAMLLPKKRDLEKGDCLDGACGPTEHDRVDSYNRLRMISGTGFIVGGVASGVGVGLLLAGGGDDESTTDTSLRPWLGVGALGVAGRFQ